MLLLLDWCVGKSGYGMATGWCPAFSWDRVNLLLKQLVQCCEESETRRGRVGGGVLCPRPTGLQGRWGLQQSGSCFLQCG